MDDAEALLFIHDHKAEPFEGNAFGQQGMRADDDVDMAAFQTFPRRFGFDRTDEAG